jgi:hypothetical protein
MNPEIRMLRLLDAYYAHARAIGLSEDRARAILDDEVAKFRASPTGSVEAAVSRASRRLPEDVYSEVEASPLGRLSGTELSQGRRRSKS